MTKPVKMSVPTFDGKDSDSLAFWVRDIEIALSAGQIYARAQTTWPTVNAPFSCGASVSGSADSMVLSVGRAEDCLPRAVLHGLVANSNGSDRVGYIRNSDHSHAGHAASVPTRQEKSPWEWVHRSSRPLAYVLAPSALIDSATFFNFSTKASVARNTAFYASALEVSHGNTDVSVRLATGSIVSPRTVVLLLNVKFDDFDSVEPFIVLDMDDRYGLILGMPWLAKHEPWIDWRSRTIGVSRKPLADRALADHVPPLPETDLCMSTFCHEANNTSELLPLPSAFPPQAHGFGDGREPDLQVPCPTHEGIRGPAGTNRVTRAHGAVDSQGVDDLTETAALGLVFAQKKVAESGLPPRKALELGPLTQLNTLELVQLTLKIAPELALVQITAVGLGAPTTQGVIVGSARAKGRGGRGACACAPKDETLRVLDVLAGKPKLGVTLAPLPSVGELMELEELSYLFFLESLKAGELEEVSLI
ncbi:unnamed protein product [Phytophthora fragariaefolia]|uniref:Unnamed protein product n=1 Tax=Phytophthora fragariaefolia TaxID=1490495 RepID=A0A9W6TSA0_9STRA|nr:unnamed protein product [Phytophthora fragariaefolia]